MLKQANLSFSVAAQSFGDDVTSIQFSTQDKNTAKLIFTIKEGKKPLDLTDAEGIVDLVMGDKSIFEDNKATVTAPLDGKLEYTITADQIRHPGRARGELQLISKDGQSIGGFRFNFTIKRALVDEYAGPVKEYYVQDLEAIKAEIRKTADSIKDIDVVRIDTKINELEQKVEEGGVGVDEQARQEIQEVTEQLAEKAKQTDLNNTNQQLQSALQTLSNAVKKNETGVLNLNVFDESTRTVLQGLEPGQINAVLGVENVQSVNIAQNSVTPDKMSIMKRSSNLINQDTFTPLTNIDGTGNIVPSTSYHLSDYINILPNQIYSSKGAYFKAYFDKSKKFISRANVPEATFTTPANAYYVRIACVPAHIGVSAQLNVGETLLPFEKFYQEIKREYIPQTTIMEEKVYFPPEDVSGSYRVVGENYTKFTTTNETINAFRTLTSQNSSYITETLKGKDASNTFPIYQYHLKPTPLTDEKFTKKYPKILLACGLHGSEVQSVYSVYYFMRDLCQHWQDNPILEYLRFNFEFVIIPLVNPYAMANFDTTNMGRWNVNGVDLNRNFSEGWITSTPGTPTYGGTAPFSEAEAQHIKSMIDTHTDAIYFGDYHSNGSSGSKYNDLMWLSLMQAEYFNKDVQIASKYLIEKMSRNLTSDYNLSPDTPHLGYISYANVDGSAKRYAAKKGIPASTFECFRKFPTETELSTENTIKGCTEFLTNWVFFLLQQFKKTQ